MSTVVPITLDYLPSRSQFDSDPPQRLYHYTDFDGAAGILQSGALWMSKFTTSNDSSELRLAIQHFKNYASQRCEQLPDDEAAFLQQASVQLDSFQSTNICVASFCESFDLLSQWRSYGNDGRGLALVFDALQLKQLASSQGLRLVRCIYDQAMHVQISNELIDLLLRSYKVVRPRSEQQLLDLLGYFNTTFLLTAPVIKDHHFHEEREWRLVSMPRSTADPQMKPILRGSHASIKYVLPLRVESKESRIISSIVIGPSSNPSNVADTVWLLAEQSKFRLVEGIHFSRIPYRGRI